MRDEKKNYRNINKLAKYYNFYAPHKFVMAKNSLTKINKY